MNIKKLVIEFVAVFATGLVIVALVTFLWNLISHGEGTVNREISLPKAQADMTNPASVYCVQNGNKLEIQWAADGSQSGVCVFPDGSTCEEWAYFRGECGPATQASPTPAMNVEATTEASGGGPGGSTNSGGNASGGYMPPGTSEEIADWWGVI